MPSIEKLKTALESLDWEKVKPLIADTKNLPSKIETIAAALQTANGLIFKYPSRPNETKRDKLINILREYLSNIHQDSANLSAIETTIETLRIAEQGYREITRQINSTKASMIDPALHVAASILLADQEFDLLIEKTKETIDESSLFFTAHTRILLDDKKSFEPDSLIEQCVFFAGMTIQMEAFRGKWFDDGEKILVPTAIATDGEIKIAQSTLDLAIVWRRWQQTEERARFLGKKLTINANNFNSEEKTREFKFIATHEWAQDLEIRHQIAFERVKDKLFQSFFKNVTNSNIRSEYYPIFENPQLLPPKGCISLEEFMRLLGHQRHCLLRHPYRPRTSWGA